MKLYSKAKLEQDCHRWAPGKCEAVRQMAVDVDDQHYGLSEADLAYIAETFPSMVQMELDRRRGKTRRKPMTRAQWDVTKPSRGLGDTIAKATSKLGMKPCGGCGKRQKKLNQLVSY